MSGRGIRLKARSELNFQVKESSFDKITTPRFWNLELLPT